MTDDGPDPWEHGDGGIRLCPECEEVTEHRYHPDCCPHDEVEEDDGRDGAGGRLMYWCQDCWHEVVQTSPNEDGETWWEVRDD